MNVFHKEFKTELCIKQPTDLVESIAQCEIWTKTRLYRDVCRGFRKMIRYTLMLVYRLLRPPENS